MVFSQCGANCVKTCANVDRPLVCTLECAPGCACPDSTYLHEGRCVAADQCPNNSKLYYEKMSRSSSKKRFDLRGSSIRDKSCNDCSISFLILLIIDCLIVGIRNKWNLNLNISVAQKSGYAFPFRIFHKFSKQWFLYFIPIIINFNKIYSIKLKVIENRIKVIAF